MPSRGVIRGAGPDARLELCQASKQPLKQSPSQALAAPPSESKPPSGHANSPFKASTLTEQSMCRTASAKGPSAAAPLVVPVKHSTAGPQRRPAISDHQQQQPSAKHHEQLALQESSAMTQHLPQRTATAGHQEKQPPAEKPALPEAPVVTQKLLEKSVNQVAHVEHMSITLSLIINIIYIYILYDFTVYGQCTFTYNIDFSATCSICNPAAALQLLSYCWLAGTNICPASYIWPVIRWMHAWGVKGVGWRGGVGGLHASLVRCCRTLSVKMSAWVEIPDLHQ